MIWKNDTGTNCVCLIDSQDHVKLFELERASPGTCLPNCGQQMCGAVQDTIQSAAVFVNEYYSTVNRDCDDVFMRTKWPLSKSPFLFKSKDNTDFLVSIFGNKNKLHVKKKQFQSTLHNPTHY